MKNTLLFLNIFSFLFFASQNIFAQKIYTEFTNPSFEDIARPQQPPSGWQDCGFPGETPPDVHPVPIDGSLTKINGVITPMNGAFGVTRLAYDGKTYLGLVVRENDTWESVGQRLESSLQSNQDYTFSVFLCKSPTYLSGLKGRTEDVNFTTPVLLRVWGGVGYCQKNELLSETNLINHDGWKKYTFNFSPKSEHTHIIFEAYFEGDYAPNGNIMLDNLSPIYLDNDYQPTQLDTLKTFVSKSKFRILFNNKNELLEESKTLLIELIKKMKVIDDIHLVFCIRASKDDNREARIKVLESFFQNLELDKKKYTVKEFKSYLEKLDWISDTSNLIIGSKETNKVNDKQ